MSDSTRPPRILIVIPAYNAAACLTELLVRIHDAVPDNELLVVDDGSTDLTPEVIAFNKVPSLRLPHNCGKGGAIKAGIGYAVQRDFDGVLTIDADLQHLPEELPRLLARFDRKAVVIGSRDLSLSLLPPQRWLSNRWTSAVVSVLTHQSIPDSQCGFRLMPIDLLRRLDLTSSDYDFETELLLKAARLGCDIRRVPVSTVYHGAPSFIRPFADVGRFLRQVWRRLWY